MSFQDILAARWPSKPFATRDGSQSKTNDLPTFSTSPAKTLQPTKVSTLNPLTVTNNKCTGESIKQYALKVHSVENNKSRGRVTFSSEVLNTHTGSFEEATASTSSRHSRRRNARNRSSFSVLMHETQQFQKLVTDLELALLRDPVNKEKVGECPEATWKARILIRSAQDADHDICAKLAAYDRSLMAMDRELKTNGGSEKQLSELRIMQTSFMKMHRDYNRSHNALDSYLTLYEKRQKVEINQLHAINWLTPVSGQSSSRKDDSGILSQASVQNPNKIEDTDFFDEAMRQRDLERINESMKTVSGIYEQLAGLVNVQQEKIDKLDDNVDHSRANFEAAAENLHCLYQRKLSQFVGCGVVDADDHQSPSCRSLSPITARFGCNGSTEATIQSFDPRISFNETPRHQRHHNTSPRHRHSKFCSTQDDARNGNSRHQTRVDENFRWSMPFETIREDIASVQNDIMSVGKGVVSQAGRGFQCGT